MCNLSYIVYFPGNQQFVLIHLVCTGNCTSNSQQVYVRQGEISSAFGVL